MEEIEVFEQRIPISDLHLWDENARFPDSYFKASEEDLIQHFVEDGNFKIVSFLKEVIKDIDLPLLEKLVVWKNSEQYIVLEGNRRLTCYKLLANPDLAKGCNEKLFQSIQQLALTTTITGCFEVDCVISPDKNTCFRYIDRKHSKNNNEVPWLEPERINYSNRRNGSTNQTDLLKIAITNYVREIDLPSEIKSMVLGKGYVTTFFRILASSSAKEVYGLDVDNEGGLYFKDPSFPDKIKVIIYNVINKESLVGKKVDSRELSKKEDIKEYLTSIHKEDAKEVNEKISNNTEQDIFGEKLIKLPGNPKVNKKTKILPKTSTRRHLIPNNCRIRIENAKINNIYRELKDDLLLDDSSSAVPNAAGVLFRVFLEVSLDYYAQLNGYLFKQSDTISTKIPWVVNSLINKGYDKRTFNNINKVGSAKKEHSYLSIDNFHEYVHSTTTQPSSSELKTKWENLQAFFELLWEDINIRKK